MTPEAIGGFGLAALFGLLVLRAPVGLALCAVGIGGAYALSLAAPYLRFEPYLAQFKTLLWSTYASDALSVVPLFVLMGTLAARAGLSADLFDGLGALLSRRRGGLAYAAIGASAGFGAVCGSSLATAAAVGRAGSPALKSAGYAPSLVGGALAAGGVLGVLIPPSVVLVLYAVLVEASILTLFQAALLPAALAVAGFAAVVWLRLRANPALAPAPHPVDAAARRAALRRLAPAIGIFGVLILGLALGAFTPTPAAAVGVFVVGLYGLATRRLDHGALRGAALDAAVTTGMIAFILFGAMVLQGFLARAGLPAALADAAADVDPHLALAGMLAALILLGCVMESLALVLVVTPFFWPTLVALNGGPVVSAADAAYGLDAEQLKIWFGILALIVVELGLITPPVGLNLLVVAGLDRETPQSEIFLGVSPFIAMELLRVAVLFAMPTLALGSSAWLSG